MSWPENLFPVQSVIGFYSPEAVHYPRTESPCRECRRAAWSNCLNCDGQLSGPKRKYCSIPCFNEHYNGVTEIGPDAKLERGRRKNRKRRSGDIPREQYTLAEIAKRDGYVCGICNGRVRMTVKHPAPGAPSIDHVTPLSRGGHDTRSNVQLAHRQCNTQKGAPIFEDRRDAPCDHGLRGGAVMTIEMTCRKCGVHLSVRRPYDLPKAVRPRP